MYQDDRNILFAILALIVLLLSAAVWCSWYSAKVQADVYRRQGIQMSTWEVWMGAKPAERVVQLRQDIK